MRAAVLHTHGEPPTHGEHPDPVAAEGISIVRVTAAPVVPLDLLCASGTSYFGPPGLPYVPGVQGVGVIEQSEILEPGTRVFFATTAGMAAGNGSFAERAAVPDDALVPLDPARPAAPEGGGRGPLDATAPNGEAAAGGVADADVEGGAIGVVGDAAVAAIGLSGVAGWMALTWRARMEPGERVLVLGGGGAVGQVAIGAARVLGAARVVAVVRSDAARERALGAGADEVVALSTDVDELTRRLGDPTYDVVIDPVFGPAATAAARVLAVGGRLVNLGGASGDEAVFSSAVLRSRTASVLGYTNNALTTDQRRDALTAVLQHAATGAIAIAHETVTLADVATAWQRQATGNTTGRLVLTTT
ncbi:quinone oxidoreductase family protein [Kribbella kalugense]|uniref:NADPH:quinone reductase-like Zn-dependent oxidoreductase n=1 Tax=Kribbella kalugense TaxID=2512221 RepID=A0A4R7ZXA5_9ACTN|nr:zinc-binding alcohol dehydrogenase family protein [Kribbella kalugense]TDW21771.1 NADPH:quinone reductase-like Zn-dependent oxidoreductase [Kribbella kalugense]